MGSDDDGRTKLEQFTIKTSANTYLKTPTKTTHAFKMATINVVQTTPFTDQKPGTSGLRKKQKSS